MSKKNKTKTPVTLREKIAGRLSALHREVKERQDEIDTHEHTLDSFEDNPGLEEAFESKRLLDDATDGGFLVPWVFGSNLRYPHVDKIPVEDDTDDGGPVGDPDENTNEDDLEALRAQE